MNISITISVETSELPSLIAALRTNAQPVAHQIAHTIEERVEEIATAEAPAKRNGKAKAEQQKEAPKEIVELAPGNIPWSVEIDGIPVKWGLDYGTDTFPVKRGGSLRYLGKQYRVSQRYQTSLKLTSAEAEEYSAGGNNGIMEVLS